MSNDMSTPAPAKQITAPWLAALRQRFRTLPLLKATGNALFLVIFFYLYLYIQRNPVFNGLPDSERARLRRQLDVQYELSSILAERIANF